MLNWDSLDNILMADQNAPYEADRLSQLTGLQLQYTERTKVRTLHDVINLLWDLDDGQTRGR